MNETCFTVHKTWHARVCVRPYVCVSTGLRACVCVCVFIGVVLLISRSAAVCVFPVLCV